MKNKARFALVQGASLVQEGFKRFAGSRVQGALKRWFEIKQKQRKPLSRS